jgi:light-regulated signal transduction histidine kinase (bacteriophytochrome)
LIVRDITERQRVSAKLESRARELVQLNASINNTNRLLAERNLDLDRFTYVVSHDLKAPLRAISNLSEWIEEDIAGQITSETQKQMQLLRGRVLRLDKLLDGLLHYSRVGRIPSQIESVEVGALLAEIVETLNPPSTFKIEISPDMPVLKARELLLKQVFSNLIDNAVKHHPSESGLVQVSVIDRGDRYEFTVADDGKGIDPKFHDKIFEIFQILESRDKRESTGIGLAIVKKIVETEGGTIHLESQVNKGATFRFTWLKSPIG